MLTPDRLARLRAMAAEASAGFVIRSWELRKTISRRKAIREDAARGMIIDKEAA
jgi:hypothetical protein